MSLSSCHSQFHPAAIGRWPARPRRLITGLTTAALMLFVPPQSHAHDGSHGEEQTGPPPAVTLKITGLQNAYSAGQPVSGQLVVTTTSQLEDGRLDVVVFDQDACVSATQCPLLFRKSYEVETEKQKSKTFAFTVPPVAVSAYTLQATLTVEAEKANRTTGQSSPTSKQDSGQDDKHPRTTLATATTRFGIRQVELNGVPDHILKGQVSSLPMNQMEKTLTACAEHGDVMDLNLAPDTHVKVKVQQHRLLADGVQVPGVTTYSSFVGQVVDAQGNVEPGSSVNLLIINGQLSAVVYRRTHPSEPQNPDLEILFVDPLPDYVKGARREQHVVYHHRHTVPTDDVGPKLHLPPDSPSSIVVGRNSLPGQDGDTTSPLQRLARGIGNGLSTGAAWVRRLAGQLAPEAAAQTPPVNNLYVIPVSVYEHFQNADNSASRWRILNRAMNQFRAEFQNITPCSGPLGFQRTCDSTKLVTVFNWLITSWQSISSSGYGNDCNANSPKFRNDTPDPHVVSVLFTTSGTNCGGIGPRPAPSSLGPHLIVVDTGIVTDNFLFDPEGYRAMVLLQELGHNFDFDPNTTVPAYDSHLAPEVGEIWFDIFGNGGCTAMHGGYGGCTLPWPQYHNVSQIPLHTLATGIDRSIPVDDLLTQTLPLNISTPADGFLDLSVGADGSVWVTDVFNRIWKKHAKAGVNSSRLWDQAPGAAVRISVGPDGSPWVVNAVGNIFHKVSADPLNGNYILLPGFARDIGVGADGSVWMIATNRVPGGYGIYKWNVSRSDWDPVPGGAVRIAVDPDGNAWVVNDAGFIFAYDPVSRAFQGVNTGRAVDIAINKTDRAILTPGTRDVNAREVVVALIDMGGASGVAARMIPCDCASPRTGCICGGRISWGRWISGRRLP